MIDELVISVIPVLLGDGVRLFQRGFPQQDLQLKESKTFDTGLVQMHFVFTQPGQSTTAV